MIRKITQELTLESVIFLIMEMQFVDVLKAIPVTAGHRDPPNPNIGTIPGLGYGDRPSLINELMRLLFN